MILLGDLMIKGWQKTSLIDYEPYMASVLFTGSCNFRCSYCQNPDLVLNPDKISDIPEQEVLDYLEKKKAWIDGVCITGGEPTMHKALPELIKKIKAIGLRVKLDTNGTNPGMLESLIKNKLLDYIAMDIKTSLEKYDSVAGVSVNKDSIKQSVDLIKNSGIDYEFRTTAVPGIVGKDELIEIGKWLKARRFVIQNFHGDRPLIDNTMQRIAPYTEEQLNEFKELLSAYFEDVKIRS